MAEQTKPFGRNIAYIKTHLSIPGVLCTRQTSQIFILTRFWVSYRLQRRNAPTLSLNLDLAASTFSLLCQLCDT